MVKDPTGHLLSQLSRGDERAMQNLYSLWGGKLYRFFHRRCFCVHESEDLVNNTFLALWKYRKNYQDKGLASAYIYRIARTELFRYTKSLNRRSEMQKKIIQYFREIEQPDSSQELEGRESAKELWQMIEKLPPEQKEVFVLHRFENMSCREIASIIEVPVKTVESRLRLALIKLTRLVRAVGSHEL